jgi:hypothetical protein
MLTIENYEGLDRSTFMVHNEEWSVGFVRDMQDDSVWDEPFYSFDVYPKTNNMDYIEIRIDRRLEENKTEYLVWNGEEDTVFRYLGTDCLKNKDFFLQFVKDMIIEIKNKTK